MKATMSNAITITPGTKQRQMNRSIMFSASKFMAHRGQPRASCASMFPQSRQVFVLILLWTSACTTLTHRSV